VNRIKAISIGKRLGQCAKVIGEIGPQLSSQLRVALWLERYRIGATLPKGFLITPETGAAVSQSDADTTALSARLDLASQIGDASAKLERILNSGVIAPTLAEQARADLSAAQDILKKSVLSAAENQKISSLLGAAVNLIESAGRDDDSLQTLIDARIAQLQAKFTAFAASPILNPIKALVPLPFQLLQQNGPAAFTQCEQDALTRKLAVMADIVQAHCGTQPLQPAETQILDCLHYQDYVSLLRAEQLVAEFKEGISVDDLRQEIVANPPRVSINIDRDTVRINTPFLVKLVFNKQRYNRAAARRRIQCNWNFGDKLTEKGWDITHYYKELKHFDIHVDFADTDQVAIKPGAPVSERVTVQGQHAAGRSHWALEIQRWFAGFFVAIIGLFAGAKEKIVSLDTVGAFFAIFLLGFGIDMAKNLLVASTTNKPASS
jgi:hypothetical protein